MVLGTFKLPEIPAQHYLPSTAATYRELSAEVPLYKLLTDTTTIAPQSNHCPMVNVHLVRWSPYVFSERRLLLVHWMLRKCPPWPTVMVIKQTLCCRFCDMSATLHPLQCLMIPIQTLLSTGCKRNVSSDTNHN